MGLPYHCPHVQGIEPYVFLAQRHPVDTETDPVRIGRDLVILQMQIDRIGRQQGNGFFRPFIRTNRVRDIEADPEVIILDEPTLGIDPKGVRELLALIRQLSRDMGITVLLSSHHLHQVQEICDRVGLFVKGKLLAVGDVPTLSQSLFGDEPISIYLRADPIDSELVDKIHAIEGVVSVTEISGQLTIRCEEDLSPAIVRAAVEQGAAVRSIIQQQYGLDEIYQRYFEGGEADAELARQA